MEAIQAGHPIASMIGGMVGGIIPIILLAILFEKIAFSMVFDDPVMGKGFSVLTAWIAASTIYGFASAYREAFNPRGFLMYGVSAIVVGAFFIHKGFKLRDMQEELEAAHAHGKPQKIDRGIAERFD
jgi:hypothetical protein